MEKRKKRLFIIGIVGVIVLLSGYGLFSAWGTGEGFGRSFRHGFHGKGFHPGFHRGDFAEFLLWRMDKGVKELGLSETQREKYDEMKSLMEKHLADGLRDHERWKEELHSEISKQDPDVRLLTGSIKKKINEISGFMGEALDLFADFYESLDNSQRDKILTPIRERMQYHEL